MRILVVHNDYGIYSGEEAFVDRFVADCREAGHDVGMFRRSSKESRENTWGKAKGFVSGIYSTEGMRMMRESLKQFRPDIINIHNLYPFISPPSLQLCRDVAPVVMTVHNYRLICPTGLFLRDGHSCETCLERGNEWSCIKHNCEENLFKSVGYALRNSRARRKRYFMDCVDRFCCLTHFQREKLEAAGFDSKKMAVIPNYAEEWPVDDASLSPEAHESPYVAYIGRLSTEKGIDLLLAAARALPHIPFGVVGDSHGHTLYDVPQNVTFCGVMTHEELARFYRGARFVVVPSRCYEGFPNVLLEAFAAQKACVVPRHGAFPELISNGTTMCGVLFEPSNVADLTRQIAELYAEPTRAEQLGLNARKHQQAHFSKAVTLAKWETLLAETIHQTSHNTP